MKQSTVGIILVFVGAALAAGGAFSFGSDVDDLMMFGIIFLIIAQDIGLGFLICLFMIPDGMIFVIYAGVAASVIGGIVCAAD